MLAARAGIGSEQRCQRGLPRAGRTGHERARTPFDAASEQRVEPRELERAGETGFQRREADLAVAPPCEPGGQTAADLTGTDRLAVDTALSSVEVQPSRLSNTRQIVDVILTYTNRQTDVAEKYLKKLSLSTEDCSPTFRSMYSTGPTEVYPECRPLE